MSAFVAKHSQIGDNMKDFTFQPLKDKSNLNGNYYVNI
jgi:hypothetical protein